MSKLSCTTCPNEDHTYAIPQSVLLEAQHLGDTSSVDDLDSDFDADKILEDVTEEEVITTTRPRTNKRKSSSKHKSQPPRQRRRRSQLPTANGEIDDDEERKKLEGVDALLNLAGFSRSRVKSRLAVSSSLWNKTKKTMSTKKKKVSKNKLQAKI